MPKQHFWFVRLENTHPFQKSVNGIYFLLNVFNTASKSIYQNKKRTFPSLVSKKKKKEKKNIMKEGHANTDDWLLILLIINNIKVQEMGL